MSGALPYAGAPWEPGGSGPRASTAGCGEAGEQPLSPRRDELTQNRDCSYSLKSSYDDTLLLIPKAG